MTRPTRRHMADPITRPGASTAEIRTDFATGVFDEEARRMDRKWGVDRLPQLVPQPVADKYARALDALNQAIRDANPETTAWAAENCVKGMRKMDELAEQAGHPKADSDAFVMVSDGQNDFAILLDDRFWPAVREKYPDLDFVTAREAAIALRYQKHELVREAKRVFAGTEVSAIRETRNDSVEDEIPF